MGSVAARARSRRGTRSAGPVERIASRQRGGVSVAPPDNVIDITDRSAFPSTQDTSGRSSIVPVRRETEPSRFIPEIATEPAEPRQTVEPLPAMARPTAALESSVDAPASAEPMPIEVPKIELAAVPVAVEPLMPEPPEGLSEGDQQRLAQVDHRAGRAADSQETLPSAAESATAARGAVTEPAAETEARAQGGLVEALNERPQPSPEIEALCERIMEAIAARRPPNEDSLLESSPVEEAQAVGQQLETSIESNSENVESSYDRLNETPTAEPRQLGQTLESPPVSVDSSDIDAQSAVPESIPDENVSLDADVEASATRMSEVGMDSETASLVQSGPIAEAREAQGELTEAAQRNPAEILVEQQEARGQAAADMAALQQQALASLQSSRSGTVGDLTSQQQGMVGTEEQMRTQIGTQAQVIFDSAQSRVNTLLDPLVPTAMRRWETGVQVLSTRFENELGRVQRWKEERHSGILGGVVEIIDNAFGYPDWIVEAYNRAERNFAEGVCRLIREISTEVNSVIAACEQIIADANTEISQLFTDLPEGLQEWAAAEQQRFTERLDGLHQQVISTRDNFNRDLAEHAAQSVQEVRQRVHELRQEAGGLLGRIAEAVNQFLEDPAKFIINGLLELVGIAATAFWALIDNIQSVVNDIANDPMNFANNLMAAIGQGFQGFFDHFPEHMFEGFFEWLFSGLGSVGVEIPTDFSLQSIFTLFLQIMGITWERIRELLARYIGEENVALLERAYELIATLIEQGPEGILEMIQEQLDPRAFIDQIVQSAVDYLLEALISAVTPRIIALFNPAGAIVQAVEAIYRLLQWIFENAARIFGLVETVVNGALDIVAGRISGMATAIEDALARTLTPVIDFLAGYLGIGDLPERIADTIRGFQEMVMQALNRIIAWLAERGRALLQMLGVGESEGDGEDSTVGDGEVGKVATFGEHRLWYDIDGTQVRVMVASDDPGLVQAKLDQWQARASELGENSSEAVTLINQARQQLEITQQKGEDANQEKQQAENHPEDTQQQGEANEADNEAEHTQDQLTPILLQLFEIFDEKPSLDVMLEQYINGPIQRLKNELTNTSSPLTDYYLVTTFNDQIRRKRGVTDEVAPKLRNHNGTVILATNRHFTYWPINEFLPSAGRNSSAWLGAHTGAGTHPASIAYGLDANGHLIGAQFGGSPTNQAANISPMQRKVNSPTFSSFENDLKNKMVSTNIRVKMNVESIANYSNRNTEWLEYTALPNTQTEITAYRGSLNRQNPMPLSELSDYLTLRPRSYRIQIDGFQEVYDVGGNPYFRDITSQPSFQGTMENPIRETQNPGQNLPSAVLAWLDRLRNDINEGTV